GLHSWMDFREQVSVVKSEHGICPCVHEHKGAKRQERRTRGQGARAPILRLRRNTKLLTITHDSACEHGRARFGGFSAGERHGSARRERSWLTSQFRD